MRKLTLGVPAYRGLVRSEHADMTVMLALAGGSHGWQYAGRLKTESCALDWSRNVILWHALEQGGDWLLFVDADTYHVDPSDTYRMLDLGVKSEAAVIAAAVPLRGRPGHNAYRDGEQLERDVFAGRAVTVDAIGTAFMAINLGWIRACWPRQPWFQTTLGDGDKPFKVGEDINFCRGVKARGGVIVCDGRFEPIHAG